jgi:hypothetical protein
VSYVLFGSAAQAQQYSRKPRLVMLATGGQRTGSTGLPCHVFERRAAVRQVLVRQESNGWVLHAVQWRCDVW